MNDLDPALPLAADSSSEEFEAAKRRANFGDFDPKDYLAERGGPAAAPRAAAAPPPPMPIEIAEAQTFLTACETSTPRVTYGLGAKVPFFRAKPGVDFKKVDCSGFVREAIREATTPMVPFPDGSVVQHDWVKDKRYRTSTVADGKKQDGKVRIAFLSPHDSPSGIGHVALIFNARTLESHGGVGPDSRPWDGASWQGRTSVYELT